jgi:DNA polymerase-3 subunit delta'
MKSSLFPWFEQSWSELSLSNMPHAVLLHGQTGIGKMEFALYLAKALLCESTEHQKPCCSCEACHWFDTGNHPDFLGIVPETMVSSLPHEHMEGSDSLEDKPKRGKKKSDDDSEKADKKASSFIKVEQIREALEGINTTPHRGRQRVVLINPVEALQAVSANTLLKTLEEPPASTLFILLSDRLDRILPTIRSRCRLIALPRPHKEQALAWLSNQVQLAGVKKSSADIDKALSESGGSVMDSLAQLLGVDDREDTSQATDFLLGALAQAGQVNWLTAAEQIYKAPMPDLLITLERWIFDLLSQQQSGQIRYYPSRQIDIEKCAKLARPNKVAGFWRTLLDARRHELHALANRVQIEALLIRYQELYKD